jgi:hypothetical protein
LIDPRYLGQSYGYEEDPEEGKLIPQYPMQSGFSGLKEDRVGPLEYNPKPEYAKFHNPPKVSFGKVSSSSAVGSPL